MKKQLVFLILILTSFTSFSQLEKGKTLVGLGFNLSTSSSHFKNKSSNNPINSNISTYFSSSLKIGKFVSDKTALGFNIGYNYMQNGTPTSSTSNNGYEEKNSSINLGAFVRPYKKIGDHFALFYQGTFNYNFGNIQTRNYDQTIPYDNRTKKKTNGFNLGLSPGLTFFPTKSLGIELQIGNFEFNHFETKQSNDNKEIRNNFNLSFSTSTFILGLSFYL